MAAAAALETGHRSGRIRVGHDPIPPPHPDRAAARQRRIGRLARHTVPALCPGCARAVFAIGDPLHSLARAAALETARSNQFCCLVWLAPDGRVTGTPRE